jgi:hypothetical protein
MNDTPRDQDVVCDNIESIAINSVPETVGVTDFVQEACTQVSVLGEHHVPSKLFRKQADVQDLTRYFGRPRLITTGTVGSSRGLLYGATNLSSSQIYAYFPNAVTRLTGVFGTKFTVVYTLQVAATPFHQGVLALAWQYTSSSADAYNRAIQPFAVTNLPHVRLDMSVDTMVQLKVPWLNPYEYGYPAYDFILGALSLTSLLATPSVAGMNPPTYKIYAHLEDLELVGAKPFGTTVVTLQSGSPINKEQTVDALPYSSQVYTIGKALRMIARGVPSLAGITGTVAWYTDAFAGGLKAFGFSKPTIVEPIQRMLKQSNALENNVDLATPVNVVGPLSTNTLQIDENFANSSVDEMALAYVLSQPCQICYGAITSAQTLGTTVYAALVSPSAMWYRQNASAPYCNINAPVSLNGQTANSFMPSGIFYFGSMFREWKGDFKFRFTFCKTKMHGGRILCAFTPQPNQMGFTDTIQTVNVLGPEFGGGLLQPTGQSKLFDLKDNNIFEFTVPYESALPFSDFTDSIGLLTLTIMDPLQVSAVVSTTINFMVEVFAGPNFELAVPRGPIYPAHTGGTVRLQSGESTVLPSLNEDACKYTIGERILSLKQLLMVPEVSDTTLATSTNYKGYMYPWYYQPDLTVTTPTPVNYQLPFNAFSFAGNISKCFAFARGGMDVHVYATAPLLMSASATAIDYGGNAPTTAPTAASVLNVPNSALPIVTQVDTCSAHLRFPAYQKFARLWADLYDSNAWSVASPNVVPSTSAFPASPYTLPALPFLSIFNTNVNTVTLRITRNAADDAMVGMYQGPVPLYLPQLASTSVTYDRTRVY